MKEKKDLWISLKAAGELDKLATAADEESYVFELDKKGNEHTHIYIYVYIYTDTNYLVYVYIYMCIYIPMFVCMYVCDSDRPSV